MIRKFTHTDFKEIDYIISQKERARLKVSLILPTLNEVATIGTIVSEAKRAFVEQRPLLDEIIVIDDGRSSDGTFECAINAGASVYRADEILRDREFPRGKGIALWKSLLVSSGDIIIYLDADITNFDLRFVYGLAAPLILYQDISFVKSFYERPLEIDGMLLENQGGRVTEILVRPFLATFYPELAHIYQPLAGEYAFRRDVAERLSFSSGYGVEIGLILDVAHAFGLSHIAQVDMGIRRHRNRSLQELGKMSFGILHVLLQKLQEHGKISLHTALTSEMVSPDIPKSFSKTVIEEVNLPPIASIRGGHP